MDLLRLSCWAYQAKITQIGNLKCALAVPINEFNERVPYRNDSGMPGNIYSLKLEFCLFTSNSMLGGIECCIWSQTIISMWETTSTMGRWMANPGAHLVAGKTPNLERVITFLYFTFDTAHKRRTVSCTRDLPQLLHLGSLMWCTEPKASLLICRGNTPLNFVLGQIFYKEIATLKPGASAIALPAFYPAGKAKRCGHYASTCISSKMSCGSVNMYALAI